LVAPRQILTTGKSCVLTLFHFGGSIGLLSEEKKTRSLCQCQSHHKEDICFGKKVGARNFEIPLNKEMASFAKVREGRGRKTLER